MRLVAESLDDLAAMRSREGTALAKDMLTRLGIIGEHRLHIGARAPRLTQEVFDRMRGRVEKLLGEAVPDVLRLNQELAVFAERTDITEELVRFDSHMVQFEQSVTRSEPVGKTLDFMLQEIGREVNTIGSKANDAEIAGHVIQLKTELERLREQVQNVE